MYLELLICLISLKRVLSVVYHKQDLGEYDHSVTIAKYPFKPVF